MANPLVRKHLKFYPEEPDGDVEDASHAEHWRYDAPANISCPMARSLGRNQQDYYVHEPALARMGSELKVVMVTRWEMRAGELHAHVHAMTPAGDGYWIDAADSSIVKLSCFLSCFVELEKNHARPKLPSPSMIHGTLVARVRRERTDLCYQMRRRASTRWLYHQLDRALAEQMAS